MRRSAIISPCGKYRFELKRQFEYDDPGDFWLGGTCAFLLNNPSKADAETEDNTSRRGIGYAATWGYDTLIFCNTNPWRSTDPKLARVPPEEILAENDSHIRRICKSADLVVAAWGGKANRLLADRACRVLRDVGCPAYALELSVNGVPKHPLYLKGDLKPRRWH